MKIATSFLAGVLFIGTMGAINSAMAEDGILGKDDITTGNYCHEKFPAIVPSTLGDDQPVLKDSSTGDMIDFYGPCNEDPKGKDQVEEQKLIELHQRFKE
jgi:hypothetical protein